RRPHRCAQSSLFLACSPRNEPGRSARASPSASRCWTSITSRRSMTVSAIRPAMRSHSLRSLRRAIRMTDRFARYGGEEFMLLVAPSTASDVARIATEHVRQAVEAHDWECIAPGLKVTVSAGVAEFVAEDSIEQVVSRADEALYVAKGAGRNRTVVAGPAMSKCVSSTTMSAY